MSIDLVRPLERAIDRMKTMLFRPFLLESWLVLGFAAFLARLTDVIGSGANGARYSIDRGHPEELGERVGDLLAEPFWLLLGIGALFLVIVLAVLFTWISSRAKFVFLDDIVRERVAIVEPWHRHARLGNSLFLWRIGFTLCAIVGTLLLVAPLAVVAIATGVGGAGGFALGTALLLVPVMLAWVVSLAYVGLFLENFIVPIMYRDGLTATKAWGRFLPLLRGHFWRFVLYGLFVLVLLIGVGVALVFAGCLTCCCGFLLMAIPYIGSVVLLPISVSYRGYGPEFLAQFGPEWSVFGPKPTEAAPIPAAAAEPPPEPPTPPSIT